MSRDAQTERDLVDKVFSSENFIATVIWQKNFSPNNSAKHLPESHEYLLAYAKDISAFNVNQLARTEMQDAGYQNPDDDERGVWTSSDLTARNYYSLGKYQVVSPNGKTFSEPLGFESVNATNSTINLVIGSRKFPEGWNSWRVSTMGFDEHRGNRRLTNHPTLRSRRALEWL